MTCQDIQMGGMPNVFSPPLIANSWEVGLSAFNKYSQQRKELGKEGVLPGLWSNKRKNNDFLKFYLKIWSNCLVWTCLMPVSERLQLPHSHQEWELVSQTGSRVFFTSQISLQLPYIFQRFSSVLCHCLSAWNSVRMCVCEGVCACVYRSVCMCT